MIKLQSSREEETGEGLEKLGESGLGREKGPEDVKGRPIIHLPSGRMDRFEGKENGLLVRVSREQKGWWISKWAFWKAGIMGQSK